MLLNTSRECNLLADLGTCRRSELYLGKITLDGEDTATGGCRTDVDEKELVFDKLGDFCLFLVLRLDAKQSAKQEQADFEFYNASGPIISALPS